MNTKELLNTLEEIETLFYNKGMKIYSRAIRESITKLSKMVDPVPCEVVPAIIHEKVLELIYKIKVAIGEGE